MSLKLDGKKLSLEIEKRLNEYISSNKEIALSVEAKSSPSKTTN